MVPQDDSASSRTQKSLLTYSLLPLWPCGSFEQTYLVFQVTRTTPTHHYGVLIDGCPHRWLGLWTCEPKGGATGW